MSATRDRLTSSALEMPSCLHTNTFKCTDTFKSNTATSNPPQWSLSSARCKSWARSLQTPVISYLPSILTHGPITGSSADAASDTPRLRDHVYSIFINQLLFSNHYQFTRNTTPYYPAAPCVCRQSLNTRPQHDTNHTLDQSRSATRPSTLPCCFKTLYRRCAAQVPHTSQQSSLPSVHDLPLR